MTDIPLTPSQIDAALDRERDIRRAASEAEAEHYRQMHRAGWLVEDAGTRIDVLLDERAAWKRAMEPMPATVESRTAVAAAWAEFEPQPMDHAQRVAVAAVAYLAACVPVVGGIQELPALVQDEHGCWLTDPDDPIAREYPDIRLGCAEVW